MVCVAPEETGLRTLIAALAFMALIAPGQAGATMVTSLPGGTVYGFPDLEAYSFPRHPVKFQPS
jgi:hypothetical protein